MIAVALKWSRYNLFGRPLDAALSLAVIPLALWFVYASLTWAFASANWAIIPESLRVLMVGVYPASEVWRSWVAVVVIFSLLGLTLGSVFRFRAYHGGVIAACLAVLYLLAHPTGSSAVFFFLCGLLGVAGWAASSFSALARKWTVPTWIVGTIAIMVLLAPPGVALWGGLLLSVLITIVTAMLTLPIGILLAFGRRSQIASIRVISTAYIELMRSVPLILVVYWIWIVMPVLAPQYNVPDVARGMVGFVIFFSAYVAEYVRSGLQSVPKGQVEASKSLGMTSFDVNRYIVLPQALRVVVPALVGNVLDIFNAAPLVFIIGLTDFLRAGQMILANPEYSGQTYEIYSFLLATYFLVGSLITFTARKLEAHMAKGAR